MKTRRLGPGLYEVDTDYGTFVVENIGRWWLVTQPDCLAADDTYYTLRDSKEAIAGQLEDIRAGKQRAPDLTVYGTPMSVRGKEIN